MIPTILILVRGNPMRRGPHRGYPLTSVLVRGSPLIIESFNF